MRTLDKSILVGVLTTLIVASSVLAQGEAFLPLPQHSVATTDDALSIWSNPAGLGVRTGGSFILLAPYQKKGDFGDWGFSFGGEGFDFAGEFIRNGVESNYNRYAWGLGFGDDGSYFGFAYRWSKGLDRQNSWDLGALVRPYRFLSVGAVVRDVNTPRVGFNRVHVGYDLGMGFRPLGLLGRDDKSHRLTITVDAMLRKFDLVPTNTEAVGYGDNVGYKIGGVIEIVPGVIGHIDYLTEIAEGDMQRDAMLAGGLTLNFGNMALGGYQTEGTGTGTAYISSSELYRPSILKPTKPRFVEVELSGPIVEHQRSFSIFRPKYRTLYKFLRKIDKLAKDPDVAGIILKIDDPSAGWAKRAEMRQALQEFKDTGKSVIVYAENLGNGDYYLASVADKIYVNPTGDLHLTGLAAHMLFLRGTLDKLGLKPELEHIGKYKSASEMLTNEEMSEGQREATDYLLDGLFADLVKAIAEGRNFTEDEVRSKIDNGPYTPADALEAGLVDGLIYEDELEDKVKELTDGGIIKENKYDKRRMAKLSWDDSKKKSVAIIYGTGAIVSGQSQDGGLFTSETMGSETIAKAIRDARKNHNVAAIVFRVDSPGGSMLASDVILREVKLCTEGDDKKPIIISMSDVAASGGYYVSCQADTIIAMPQTITGSIGVITGKLAYQDFQRKIGVNTATLRRGEHADMWAGWRSFTDEEWEKVRDQINQYYQTFLTRVSEGRGIDKDTVHSYAQGRVWTGSQALDRGLIDITGGLDMALELAARAGGLEEGAAFEVELYPRWKGFDWADEMQALVLGGIPEPVRETLGILHNETRWDDGEPLYLMPFQIEIE